MKQSQEEDLYLRYQDWKAWGELFVYSDHQAGYFASELSGLNISNAKVLEIGFGSGSCVAWLLDNGADVSVTEVSRKSCSEACERGIAVLPMDLPNAAKDFAESFDTIIAFDVFEHLDLRSVGNYLDAAAILLKPGGCILLRFPNAQSPFGLAPQAGDPTHKTGLSLSVMRLLIAGRPFKVVRYSPAYLYLGRPFTFVWLKRLIRRSLQKVITLALNFIYATKIPYEPVVVVVLKRDS